MGFSHSWAAPMSPRSYGVETWPLTVKPTMRYGTRTLLCPDGTFNTICVPLGSSTNVTTREIMATPKTMPTRIDLETAISAWSRKRFRADTDGSVTPSTRGQGTCTGQGKKDAVFKQFIDSSTPLNGDHWHWPACARTRRARRLTAANSGSRGEAPGQRPQPITVKSGAHRSHCQWPGARALADPISS